eukprot:CAMPEP_0197081330 /NCGR_PEP_ID=MMETSP1384-20130603/214581_1 /TAXON_ID=29189 /ORGANISM="Ammonia sp." /LENGTH=401 /DNA_ID=CAMNT_0042520225 /DNA_START=93 /DNA_END=1295 /DNA_ORIENTATION=+
MNNYTSHWIASGEGIFATDDTAFCVSSSCVGIGGYSDGDDWLVRSTPLLLIPNLERITSFVVQFDVTIFDIESSNACQVKYKYDTDADTDYKTIASFSSSDLKHIKLVNETRSILIDKSKLNQSQVLSIKLEAHGDSSSGGDLCFFDNVYLFGQVLENEIIWNACQVKYKYDIDADYRTIASFSSASSKHIKLVNETGSILVEQNKLNDSQVLLIKLEALADGDSSSGGDLCFFDNVYLFGEALDSAIIWSDTMDTDPMTNGWIPSNNESVVFTSTSAYCSSTSCVEISGYSELENSMYHIVPDVDRCFDLFIQFDVALVDMESENACQVMYRYDTDEDDEFFSLSSIGGGNGDQLKMQNMASIPINPQHANATNLYVRLKNNGDSSSGNVTAPTTTTAAE